VVDKVALGQVFSSTSVSPDNLHFTNFSTITITYHPGLAQQASSGRSTTSHTAQIKKKIIELRLLLVSMAYFSTLKTK
jgi:hypothetical protein